MKRLASVAVLSMFAIACDANAEGRFVKGYYTQHNTVVRAPLTCGGSDKELRVYDAPSGVRSGTDDRAFCDLNRDCGVRAIIQTGGSGPINDGYHRRSSKVASHPHELTCSIVDAVVQQVPWEPKVQSKTITDYARSCLDDNRCKSLLSAAEQYATGQSSFTELGDVLVKPSQKQEDHRWTYKVPSADYRICHVIVDKASARKATFGITIQNDRREAAFYSYTYKGSLGSAESYYRAVVKIISIHKDEDLFNCADGTVWDDRDGV